MAFFGLKKGRYVMAKIKHLIFDMGNVLMRYDPEVPLREYVSSEEARDLIRKELFQGPE